MKRLLLLNALILQGFVVVAQHCPLDCSGMILLQSSELFAGNSEKMRKEIQPFILNLDCDDLFLRAMSAVK